MDPGVKIVWLSFVHRYVEFAKLKAMASHDSSVGRSTTAVSEPYNEQNVRYRHSCFPHRVYVKLHSLGTVEKVSVVSDACPVKQAIGLVL